MLYTFTTKQTLHANIDAVWEFMSRPTNLALITPKHMGFEVLNGSGSEPMFAGQIIEYNVAPVLGIKLHWVTEITHVKEKEFFVDEQRFGPYKFWHHKHSFRVAENGVEMLDVVHYSPPFGPLGRLANSLFIKNELKKIFEYRYKVLDERFNSSNPS
jgi:ligand-binding SRPBCC domain-containing protein